MKHVFRLAFFLTTIISASAADLPRWISRHGKPRDGPAGTSPAVTGRDWRTLQAAARAAGVKISRSPNTPEEGGTLVAGPTARALETLAQDFERRHPGYHFGWTDYSPQATPSQPSPPTFQLYKLWRLPTAFVRRHKARREWARARYQRLLAVSAAGDETLLRREFGFQANTKEKATAREVARRALYGAGLNLVLEGGRHLVRLTEPERAALRTTMLYEVRGGERRLKADGTVKREAWFERRAVPSDPSAYEIALVTDAGMWRGAVGLLYGG